MNRAQTTLSLPKRKAASATHEQGAYQGDRLVEILERLVRVEVRQNKFMRYQGFNPVKPNNPTRVERILVDGRDIVVTSTNTTLGEISTAANDARLEGRCRLFVGPNYWGDVEV